MALIIGKILGSTQKYKKKKKKKKRNQVDLEN